MSRVEVTRTGIPLEAYDYVASLIALNKKLKCLTQGTAPDGNSAALHYRR